MARLGLLYLFVGVVLSLLSSHGFCAEFLFRFGSYYADHMVLQKEPGRAVVWGYGAVGAIIRVSVRTDNNTLTHEVTRVNQGVWNVFLRPFGPGGPFWIIAEQNYSRRVERIVLKDVYFGDIWLCGGQSNMEMTVLQIINASEVLSLASHYPYIRLFQAGLSESAEELNDLDSIAVQWSIPTAEILGQGNFTSFSAVCWLFGQYLYDKLQYPIGLVESCWGGTPIEAWSSQRVLHKCEIPFSIGNRVNEKSGPHQPTVLWNAMIHPLRRMTITGAIWYQGEANTNWHIAQYNCTFPAMIEDWRQVFHQGSGGATQIDFPFGFVQLSTYHHAVPDDSFPWIRWHQTADFGYAPNPKMKRTFMAVAMDLGDEKSPYGTIHPRYKQDVAYRLYLGARAVAYKETAVVFQGPFPKDVQLKNSTELTIIYTQELTVLELSHDIFEVCCCTTWNLSNCKWISVPIVDHSVNSISLSLNQCHQKVTGIRYAWMEWPCDLKKCPLYSKDSNLPAPTFMIQPAHNGPF
ncbi:sialate O-acetylesterase isoform X1 [Chiloscyllium plagiosum]|uniref:sialate O-acetylesterase isoform X1 n=2 Tax=Chiloscyllium plagiosum TaxID=36176 RepID=UPI001CB83EC7|nr:sialate O-acetylesterase isoform X1 [Chiloscyllium plagiosum]